MSEPDLTVVVEVAFGVDPGVVPTTNDWVDLSDRLDDNPGLDWTYGRHHELDRMEAGVGSVTLDNSDRHLDPTNTDSPFAGDLEPMTPIRIQVWFGGVLRPIVNGFVHGWAPDWSQERGWVTIPVVDGLEQLSRAPAAGPYTSKLSGARIGDILDEAGWPAGRRDLDDGTLTVQAVSSDPDRIALTAIRDTALSEDGAAFVGPDGDFVFQDRLHRQSASVNATFGDDGSELAYTGLRLSRDVHLVRNIVAASADGLATQTFTESSSVDRYGKRREALGTLLTSTADLSAAARRRANRRADANVRVDTVTVETHFGGDGALQALTRMVGDRIRIRARPPGGGPAVDRNVTIERVTHRAGGGMRWLTTWQLGSTVVTLGQHDTLLAGQTLGDHDTSMSGQTLGDHDADPLAV